MNIHEYQAKKLLSENGIAVPPGAVAASAQQAEAIAKDLGGEAWVVKAQIHASGRGKGHFRGESGSEGGIRFANSVQEVAEAAEQMLGKALVTSQTGSEGKLVNQVYVEKRCQVEREIYLAMFVDRSTNRIALIASPEGGVNVENMVKQSPESLLRVYIDLESGLGASEIDELLAGLGLQGRPAEVAAEVITRMYKLFTSLDASLIEINPLAVVADGDVLALDAKITFDDNALFRHKNIAALRDDHQFETGELQAQQHGFNYIKMDGNIGCMTCGAGLAMAIIDAIKQYGGSPANFLDIPPITQVDRAKDALNLLLADPGVESILINVFGGGIMTCDTIADAIILANRERPISVPLIVRLVGTNADFANRRLLDSGPEITFAENLADAAKKAVDAAAAVKLRARRSWWDKVQTLVGK